MPKGLPSFKCCRSLSKSPSTEVKNPPREPCGRQVGEKRQRERLNIQNKGIEGAIDEEGGMEGRQNLVPA